MRQIIKCLLPIYLAACCAVVNFWPREEGREIDQVVSIALIRAETGHSAGGKGEDYIISFLDIMPSGTKVYE